MQASATYTALKKGTKSGFNLETGPSGFPAAIREDRESRRDESPISPPGFYMELRKNIADV
jgi:hypothetical protein